MKTIIFAALMTVGATSFAGNVVNTRDYTCSQLQSMLANEGTMEVASSWGSNIYVADAGYCIDGRGNPAYVHSSDKSFCSFGFVCQADQGQ